MRLSIVGFSAQISDLVLQLLVLHLHVFKISAKAVDLAFVLPMFLPGDPLNVSLSLAKSVLQGVILNFQRLALLMQYAFSLTGVRRLVKLDLHGAQLSFLLVKQRSHLNHFVPNLLLVRVYFLKLAFQHADQFAVFLAGWWLLAERGRLFTLLRAGAVEGRAHRIARLLPVDFFV